MADSRGPILIVNVLIFGIIAFCFVISRLGFRLYTRKTSASDWFLAAALVSSLAQDAFNAACVTQWGYGQHKYNLPKAVSSSPVPLKLLWLNQIFFKLTTMATKLSICLIYHNIFKRANSRLIRATRLVVWALTVLIIGYYVAAFFVSIFQCTPVSKSWHSKEKGTCIDLTEFRYYTAAANIVTSVLIIVTPLPALSKMRQTRPEVTELMGLILLGLIHTGCTIVRLIIMVYPAADTASDPQYTSIVGLTIAIVEMDIGIIAASLIVMRPCFEAVRKAMLKRHSFSKISYAQDNYYNTSSQISGQERERGIVRTIDLELESRPVHVERFVPKTV